MQKLESYVDTNLSYMFCVFFLSRGVYNLKKQNLEDYYKIIMDRSNNDYMENWMEFDRLYLFDTKLMKKDVENVMVPYHFMLDPIKIRNATLIDGKKYIIMFEYDVSVDLLVFENIIEAWKFYNYIGVLYLNAVGTQNSICYDININLRVLFDETRFSSMENVFLVLVDNYNHQYNKKLSEKLKVTIDEDQINFKAITEFYEIFLVAYYSLADYAMNFDNLRIFINRFHELYFEYIKDILRNPYTEVS